MSEKNPTPNSTENIHLNHQERLEKNWGAVELEPDTILSVSSEHTSKASPEIASFHLGAETSYEDRRDNGALFHIVDTSKLQRFGNYYKYEGFFFDASNGGDYLVVSSTDDNTDTRRGTTDASPDNFTYRFLSKGEQLTVGRDTDDGITPNLDSVSRQHMQLDVDEAGNISFVDLHSTNGTTVHLPEQAVHTTKELLAEDSETLDENEPLRTEAHELLSKSELLHVSIAQTANEYIRKTQSLTARTRNRLSTPKNDYLRLRRDRAQAKYDRKAAKQGTSAFKFINKRRDKVATKAQAKLSQREQAYGNHSSKMDKRLERVDTETSRREQSVTQFIEQAAEARVIAEQRKLERKERQRRKHELTKSEQHLSNTERHKIINAFTPEDTARIRAAAIKAVRAKQHKNHKE